MGGFYALAGDRAPKRLSWANFAVSNLGLWLCIPSLALLLLGNMKVLPVLMISEPLLVGGMVLFGINILLTARAPKAVSRPTLMQAA